MMCEGYFSEFERIEVLEIHRHPQLLDQCCDLLNMEWPRSKTIRLRSLEMSCDSLPTCLVLTQCSKVLGHSKLSPIPGLPLGCIVHSVIVHPEHRGKGLGKFLMAKTEECAKRRGKETVYLSTKDKQGFYSTLGYTECEPVQMYGGPVLSRQNSKIVPPNETNTKYNIHICAKSVSSRNPSFPSIPDTGPLPPPPPPPPPLPKLCSLPYSAHTYMKKNI